MGITTATSFIYALGGIMKGAMLSLILLFGNTYLLEVAKIDPATLGSMMVVIKIIDALNDPVLGYMSDNTSIFGMRRTVWIVGAVVPACIFYVMIWVVPPHWMDAAVYYSCMYILFDIFMSAYEVNYEALTAEMTINYEDRLPLVYKKTMVYIIASLVATVSQAYYMANTEQRHPYATAALVVVLVSMPFAIVCAWRCRERGAERTIYTHIAATEISLTSMDAAWDAASNESDLPSVSRDNAFVYFVRCMLRDYAQMCTSVNYMSLTLVNMCVSVTTNILMVTLTLYVKYVLREDAMFATYVILRVQLGVIVGLTCISVLTRLQIIHDKKTTLRFSLFAMMCNSIALSFVRQSDAVEVVFGMCIAGTTSMIQCMLPDVVDYMQKSHPLKVRSEGSYYGFFAVMHKLGAAVAIPVVNFTLAAKGFDLQADVADDTELAAYIHRLFSVIPPVFIAVALCILEFYGIGQVQHVASIVHSSTDAVSQDF